MLADDLEEVLDDTQVKYIQLDDYIVASTQNEDQTNVKQEVSRLLERAYPYFKAGLEIHDQLEEVFINEMDFEKADKIAEKFIESLFKSVAPQRRQSIVYERLFGTNTPDGFVNHLEGLIEPIGKRFFIKGRAGTGKSFFMNKVLKECKLRGLDVELYRCSFDPNSIDMLIIRQLNTCLFDSTPPHELFPSRQTDEVIDFYEKTVTSGTDELYANQIEQLTRDYKAEMNNGMKEMKAIKQIEERTEKVWRKVRKEKIQSVIKKI